ncbi:hypothetical protein FRB99_004909 [Tulasnella sp. 403]|nr:hypothetical protein FRB99_004909 [Tulasnella sp. 403]
MLALISYTRGLQESVVKLYSSALQAAKSTSPSQTFAEPLDPYLRSRGIAIDRGLKAMDVSSATKPLDFAEQQEQYPMQIGHPFKTIGPPINIYHPVFTQFKRLLVTRDISPTPQDIETAFDFLQAAVEVYQSDGARLRCITPFIENLLGNRCLGGGDPSFSGNPDGIIYYHTGFEKIPLLVIEATNEFCAGLSDPGIRGAFSYRKLWADTTAPTIRNACCSPHPDIRIGQQPGSFRLAEDVAHMMVVLRSCLDDLQAFYDGVSPKDKAQIEAVMPVSQSFGNLMVRFTSGNLQSDSYGRALFDAVAKSSDEQEETPVKVKVVPRYGKEAHILLAEERLAPKLLHCEKLDAHWTVVIMESIPGPNLLLAGYDRITPRVLTDIQEAVSLLHRKNLVFGDLRSPNIVLCDRHTLDGVERGAMLVDFDWAGTAGEQRYPLGLNMMHGWPKGVKANGVSLKEHDLGMLEKLRAAYLEQN